MTSVWWGEETTDREPIVRRAQRRWRDKFAEAWRGVKRGIRGHSNFFVHFFFAALALAMATVLQCALWEWCIIIGCIGLVLTAELLNSAIETLFHGLDADSKARIEGCLDIAAGAVLVASMTAAIVGCLIFGYRLLAIWY